MKSPTISLFLIGFLFTSVLFSQKKDDSTFSFKWDNGFKLESTNQAFKLKFGGRIMIDFARFYQNTALDNTYGLLATTTGSELRRARIFTSGTLYSNVDFKFSVDFAGDKTTIKDAYIGIEKLPIFGNLRIGRVKEPFRLNVLTSSKYITFIERSFATDFMQERNNGVLFFNDFLNKKVSIQAGYFLNEDNSVDDRSANDGYAITARTTSLLINNNERDEILHVGIGYSYRKPTSKNYRVESKPESHLSRIKYIFTGLIDEVEKISLVNFETAYVHKSFALQAEYLMSNTTAVEHYQFATYYGQVSYFLTGESKSFKNSYEGFNRLHPNKNYGSNGYGAWQIALRYSHADLQDKNIFGGQEANITVGLNWYLNPATRFQFNQTFAQIKNKGNASIFQCRLQIDF